MRREQNEAEKRIKAEYPEFFKLRVSSEIRAYKKPPKGWSGHQLRIVNSMLENPAFLRLTNAEVLKRVRDWYDGYEPSSSVMYRPLYRSSRPKIEAALQQRGIELRLNSNATLSKIKKVIQAKRSPSASSTFNSTIEISEQHVIVDDRSFPIETGREHPSVRVSVGGRRPYLRVDVLKALLTGDTPSST